MTAQGGNSRGALAGLRVVDLSRVLAGPLCTQMLADHGADVVKVEPPSGDETRTLGPPFDDAGDASYFSSINRGKRSIALDLAQPAGRAVLERLLAGADVLIENFLPGTMDRWGLGYDAVLAPRHPRLIYCSITGFGADGPLGGLPGYDAVLQAVGGLMSVNGEPSSGPTRVGVPVVDHLTGYCALVGILLALAERARSGRGQRIEATLFDTALSLLVPHAANWLASGREPQLLGSAHPNIAPYDKFEAGGGPIFLGILNDKQFQRFCHAIARPELATDARFLNNAQRLQNREQLRAEIEPAMLAQPREQLCRELMRNGVPAGPVNTVSEALEQPHAAHRAMRVGGADGYRGLGLTARLGATPGRAGIRPPRFSEHGRQVLREAGYSDAEIDALRDAGVLLEARR